MGKITLSPATVTAFTTAFLATDYLWYKQDFKNINSIVWRHILSGSGGPTSLQKQSSR